MHPNSDHLLILKLSLGTEKRQIVAGLRNHYELSDLKGKKIVLVANLKKAKLRGEVSEGMLLAAADGEKVVLLKPDEDSLPGDRINLGDLPFNMSGQLTIDELKGFNLKIENVDGKNVATATVSGKQMTMNRNGISISTYGEVGTGSTVR